MTKLSYDDGVVRSSVVKMKNGEWLELRRGELTGAALREAGQRRWASKEDWLSTVCEGGTEMQEWAILGSYETSFWTIYEESFKGTAPGDGYKERSARGKEKMLQELRYLQGRYNEAQSERARLYWAEMIQDIAQVGYCGVGGAAGRATMWVMDWPEIAHQIYALSQSGRYTAQEEDYKARSMCGFWFHILYQNCMGEDFVHDAVEDMPARLDLFANQTEAAE